MHRTLRTKLANGKTVYIDTAYGSENEADKVIFDNKRLEQLIESKSTSESELLNFLANILPVIIPESDPQRRVVLHHGPVELGMDLSFELRDNSGVGIVQIKSPKVSIMGT